MRDKALRMALEALEKADRHCPVNTEAEVFVRLAITAIKQALAAPVQALPDVLTEHDYETIEYRNGWNDCRQLMMTMIKD